MAVEKTNQYLTFTLDEDSFAIEILKVREVLDYEAPTRVPRSPDFLVGVINLRGNVVPVVDMRVILGLSAAEISSDSCIIIIEINIADENIIVGALADSVQKVVDIPASAIGPAPKIGTKLKIEFLTGIGKVGGQFVMILNMDRVLSLEELDLVENLTSMAAESFIKEEEMQEETLLEQ